MDVNVFIISTRLSISATLKVRSSKTTCVIDKRVERERQWGTVMIATVLTIKRLDIPVSTTKS